MGISSINPFNIGNMQRAGATSQFVKPVEVKSTNQNVQEKGFKGFATTEDMERVLAFQEGKILSSKVNPTQNKNVGERGALFEGFTVPKNNGTGELIPQYALGERVLDLTA